MTVKLGYCIHCGQANITCINAQKDGTMTHYSIAKQGECGPLIIDDVEIPEPNWKGRPVPAANTEGLRELLKAADDLCFECDGVLQTKAPSRETYNRAYLVIKAMKDMLGDAALRGEGEPPDPDLNADGPAERAHRQDEARRMK